MLGKVVITDSANHIAYGSMTVVTKVEREENAIIRYYSAIDEVLTRADVFLTHISYSYVKEQVFYVLIDAELYILMDQATRMGDLATALSIQTLISDEQYHINIVQNSYPDTYNFLMSLRDARHNIAEYY